jgi:hypothetical protein
MELHGLRFEGHYRASDEIDERGDQRSDDDKTGETAGGAQRSPPHDAPGQ